MGMQMMNDPYLYLEPGETPLFDVNTEVNHDLFVIATRDISPGEEIFMRYEWKEVPSDDDNSKPSPDGNQKNPTVSV
jgi:hypothetical protein